MLIDKGKVHSSLCIYRKERCAFLAAGLRRLRLSWLPGKKTSLTGFVFLFLQDRVKKAGQEGYPFFTTGPERDSCGIHSSRRRYSSTNSKLSRSRSRQWYKSCSSIPIVSSLRDLARYLGVIDRLFLHEILGESTDQRFDRKKEICFFYFYLDGATEKERNIRRRLR